MKTIIILITLAIATTTIGCEKDTTTICENLLEEGSADISLLEGEWELEYIAYTPNGKRIKDKESISEKWKWSGSKLVIFGNISDSVNMGGKICNSLRGYYSLYSPNNISIFITTTTYIYCTIEMELLKALNNSQCYIIKDNKLFLHYKSHKSHNNKNILILNKK